MSGLEGRAVLAPLAGDPGEVRRVAAGLGAQAELLAALARTVRGLADPALAVWAGPAGEAFGRRAGAVPAVLERVANRYGVASSSLRRLAQALEEGQAEVARAQQLHAGEWGPFLRAGDQMGLAENSPDPAQRQLAGRYRAEMVAHGELVQLAVRRHAEAHESYAAADRACAGVLHGLLDDGLADSRLYDALTGTSRIAGEVEGVFGALALIPPARPLGVVASVAGGIGVAADAVVLVGYGDGDLAGLALATGAAAAGSAGTVLKAGARATNVSALASARTRTARGALRLTTGDRLVVGLRAAGNRERAGDAGKGIRLVDPPKPRAAQRWTPPPRSPAALRPWLREQTAVRASTWVRGRWLDDLSTVVRDEGASTRWHVAGLAADGAARGLRQGEGWRERTLDARREADLRQSGEQHR